MNTVSEFAIPSAGRPLVAFGRQPGALAGQARQPGRYLAGDDASFAHGAVLPVDGGRTAV